MAIKKKLIPKMQDGGKTRQSSSYPPIKVRPNDAYKPIKHFNPLELISNKESGYNQIQNIYNYYDNIVSNSNYKTYNNTRDFIKPTQGTMRGSQVSKDMIKDLIKSADKHGIPRDVMVSIAANESMFGKGYSENPEKVNQKAIVSGWDTDNDFLPKDPDAFLYSKKVPNLQLNKTKRGYEYSAQDFEKYKKSVDSTIALHPEYLDEYDKQNKNVKTSDNINYFDQLALDIKKRGIGGMNAGSKNYEAAINKMKSYVVKDTAIQNVYKEFDKENTNKSKIKKMADGGPIKKKSDNRKKLPVYVKPSSSENIHNPDFLGRMDTASDQEVLNWTKGYINSPKYKERLSNFYTNPDEISKQRLNRVNDIRIIDFKDPLKESSSLYDQQLNNILIDNNHVQSLPGNRRDNTIAHEISHATNNNMSDSNFRLTPEEEAYMLDREKTYGNKYVPEGKKSLGEPYKKIARDNKIPLSNLLGGIGLHDVIPSELKSDIDDFRFQLKRAGLYDANTQDINQDILDKAKKDIRLYKQFDFKRLLDHYEDADLIDIMNKVAVNNTENSENNIIMAKKGTQIKRKINKMDFGGPIPIGDVKPVRDTTLMGPNPLNQISKGISAVGIGNTANLTDKNLQEQARINYIVNLSKKYGVPTNKIYSKSAARRIDKFSDIDSKYIDYELQDTANGNWMTFRQNFDDKAVGYPVGTMIKRKYGGQIKKMALGGINNLDPNDPLFAQKMQEFLKDNPDAGINDIFQPTSGSNPPGMDSPVNIDSTQVSDQAWSNDISKVASPNTNTNAQQKNKFKLNVKIPSINLGDAVAGLAQGADALVTKYIDEPRKIAQQMRRFRRGLTAVTSPNSQGGYDMPILAKSGIQINSAYTNNVDPVDSKYSTNPRNPWGNRANNYKVDDPSIANVQVEGGEFLELPEGQTSNITGDKHSDYSGGELMSLPEGARVYSDSIKVDKDFAKDLTGSKFKRKKTVADVAKKYNTDHEEEILKDVVADNISKRSANIMKTFKQHQLQQLFDYQEAVKDPMYMLNKDTTASDITNSPELMQDGGKSKKKVITDDQRSRVGLPMRYDYPTFQPGQDFYAAPNQVDLTGEDELVTEDPTLTQVTPSVQGLARSPFRKRGQIAPARTTDNLTTVAQSFMSGASSSAYTDPQYSGKRPLVAPTSTPKYTTPNSTPDPLKPWTPIELTQLQTAPTPELQYDIPPTTIQPGTTIDPNKYQKPIPDNNKANPPAPNPKVPWSNSMGALGELAPEILATIQNNTDFPIFNAKFQPKYLNPVEMNIQASLNKNYAQTQSLLESTGNAATDNARHAQAIANLYDANNQMFEQKFNFDTQNRYQTDNQNIQTENAANKYNLERTDAFWDKVTQRQAAKEASNNSIANSAYAKFKRKELEQRSLQLTNQMFDNYKYDPQRGIYFDNRGNQFVFHEPTGNFINIGTQTGDGVETTKTTRQTPKGTTTTFRQKEKKGS